jgi:hypothetical protein
MPGTTLTCSIASRSKRAQRKSTNCAARISAPSEACGATFLAASATPKWPMNMNQRLRLTHRPFGGSVVKRVGGSTAQWLRFAKPQLLGDETPTRISLLPRSALLTGNSTGLPRALPSQCAFRRTSGTRRRRRRRRSLVLERAQQGCRLPLST